MISKLNFLKRTLVLFKVVFLCYSVNGQISSWGDISSGNINYSVVSVVEGKDHQLFVLGKVTDKDFKNLKIGYSRISGNGEILINIVFPDEPNLYDLNSIFFQPDGLLRVYGTSFLQSGMMAPYMNYINPENNTISNSVTLVSTPIILAKPSSLIIMK